jgi:HSP20 family molecular chaperone IbpA
MIPMDENYFENLANGKRKSARNNDADETNAEETEEGTFEVELAKASTTPARNGKTTHAKSDWDNEPEGQLTVDVYQTPEDIVIESAIAGVRPEDIDINVTNDAITIKGLRYHETSVDDKDYLYQECYWGHFGRSIILPQEVDPEGADVTFKNGILTVRLPKTNRKKTRKLKVRID